MITTDSKTKVYDMNIAKIFATENDNDWMLQIQLINKKVENFSMQCDNAGKFQDFLNKQVILLEENINSEIQRIQINIDIKQKDSPFSEKIKWLNSQKVILNDGIMQIRANIEQFKLQNQMDDIDSVVSILELSFSNQKGDLIQNYNHSMDLLIEKLTSNELLTMQDKMDKKLHTSQEKLNDFVY